MDEIQFRTNFQLLKKRSKECIEGTIIINDYLGLYIKLIKSVHMDTSLENPLSDFFENGDLSFLFNDLEYNKVEAAITSDPELENKVAQKLSSTIVEICKDPQGNTLYALGLLLEFTHSFSPTNLQTAYDKTYAYFDSWIKRLNENVSTPFEGHKSTVYKSEIGLYVDEQKSKFFDSLPTHFQKLDKAYCDWCLTYIVKLSTARKKEFKSYQKRDLKIFLEAAGIAGRHHDTSELQSNIKLANEALQTGGKIQGATIFGTIVAVYLIVRLILSFFK